MRARARRGRGTDPTFEPKHFVSGSNDRREERERRDVTFQPKHFVFGSNDHRERQRGRGRGKRLEQQVVSGSNDHREREREKEREREGVGVGWKACAIDLVSLKRLSSPPIAIIFLGIGNPAAWHWNWNTNHLTIRPFAIILGKFWGVGNHLARLAPYPLR